MQNFVGIVSNVLIQCTMLPKSERDGGKDCILCAKTSFKSLSRHCMALYNWLKSATLFSRNLIFPPCFVTP